MNDVVIPDKQKFEEIKKAIAKDGSDKIHVISDFDRTLTYAFVNGEKSPSLISILRDGNYLTPEYAQEAHALFEKYHPIEIDPKVPNGEKRTLMEEWWNLHFELLISCRLNKRDIKKAAKDTKKIKLRKAVPEFLHILHEQKIPLVIMSASGLGNEMIAEYLTNQNLLYSNIHIISNSFEWNKDGYAIKVERPIIHNMNKNEITVQNYPVFQIIKNRTNVILLGDQIDDVEMIEGYEYKNLLKIGFLNEDMKANLTTYQENYSAVIINDSSLKFVVDLMKDIVN